jgi:prephenate dehydratase
VAEALMGLKRICLQVRYLGSYPRADMRPGDVRSPRPGTSDEEFVSAADWVARCQDGRF